MKKILSNSFTTKRVKKLFTLSSIGFLSILSLSAQEANFREDCDVKQAVFKHNDYDYELWQSNDVSDACMKTKQNGDFTVSWSTINNTLARKGKRPGVPNQQINYTVNSTFTGNVFYGAYGWWRSEGETGIESAVEYYVVENYGVNKPTDGGELAGIVNSDGADYEVYIIPKYGQPNVYGINDFTQIKCIRVKDKLRSSGTITMANHFNKWASLGWPAGDLYEVSMKIEGYSNGPSDPTEGEAKISVDMATSGTYVGTAKDRRKKGKNLPKTGPLSGTYFLQSKLSNRFATSDNKFLAAVKESPLQKDWNSQHWKLIYVGYKMYRLKELYGGRYLQANPDGTVFLNDLKETSDAQIWTVVKRGKDFIGFKDNASNLFLENKNENWGVLKASTYNNTDAQKWKLVPLTK